MALVHRDSSIHLGEVRPHVVAAEAERALNPGDSLRECAKDCPDVVVVPAAEFIMGSPSPSFCVQSLMPDS